MYGALNSDDIGTLIAPHLALEPSLEVADPTHVLAGEILGPRREKRYYCLDTKNGESQRISLATRSVVAGRPDSRRLRQTRVR